MSYFVTFYEYDVYPQPALDSIVCRGRFDIGCGGDMDWYILSRFQPTAYDSIKYNNERYVYRYLSYDDQPPHTLLLTNDPKLPEGLRDMYDDDLGEIFLIDTELNRSTYLFDDKGNPIWKD